MGQADGLAEHIPPAAWPSGRLSGRHLQRSASMNRVLFAALLSAALLFAGCGKGNESSQADPNDPVIRRGGVATIVIKGDDQMRYDTTAFTVHPGEKVRIILENVGKMPIATMGHDLVVLKQGQDYKAFANEAASQGGSADNAYLPASLADKVIAHTKLLGPGEKDTITFTAPAAGEYPYVCTFPGHFVFMNGVMTVK
jgi:azurin